MPGMISLQKSVSNMGKMDRMLTGLYRRGLEEDLRIEEMCLWVYSQSGGNLHFIKVEKNS